MATLVKYAEHPTECYWCHIHIAPDDPVVYDRPENDYKTVELCPECAIELIRKEAEKIRMGR